VLVVVARMMFLSQTFTAWEGMAVAMINDATARTVRKYFEKRFIINPP
jgi:hypothetical protein